MTISWNVIFFSTYVFHFKEVIREDGFPNTQTLISSYRLTWERLLRLPESLIKDDMMQAGGQRPTLCLTVMMGQRSRHTKMERLEIFQ